MPKKNNNNKIKNYMRYPFFELSDPWLALESFWSKTPTFHETQAWCNEESPAAKTEIVNSLKQL